MTSTSAASLRENPTAADVLVRPEWLAEHLHDPDLRVIEVDVSPAAYVKGHIESAVLWNVYQDLKDPDYRTVGRPAVQELLERSGVEEGSTVVFYGYAPAMGFWLMKLYGHADVRILDCDRRSWAEADLPWTEVAAAPVATRYRLPGRRDTIRAGHALVRDAIGDAAWTIADVRTDSEFRGERFWPSGGLEPGGRAGHVPSALNLSVEGIYDEHGSFRTPGELRELFAACDPANTTTVITYCTIGGRASTAWFVLTYLLGRDNVRVYDGSWAEWGMLPATPVAT